MTEGLLVVTGGTSGIGLACAKAMAGAHEGVVLVDANGEGWLPRRVKSVLSAQRFMRLNATSWTRPCRLISLKRSSVRSGLFAPW